MIVDAVGRAQLSAAAAAGANRVGVNDPGGEIERMNAPLDDEIP